MAGDLEDFLRRAAERRKAKAAQQQQQQPQQRRQPAPPRRPQPEYTDRRAERIVRPEPEPVLVAEIVEDPLAERRRKLAEAKKAAAKAQAEAAKKAKRSGAAAPRSSGATPALTGDVAGDLIKILQHPGGLRQAILLREILDRPEHRW